ncbi:hypothetical protein [Endozoicomonas sp. Mp262]|uniref:hypothetical protein n=1 Tax=Endozoicomonas sp. Mp262 TaxID=2919499 RepID=UPI0021D97ADD
MKEAYKNSIRFQLRQDPNLSPCEKGSLLNDVIGLDDTLSNLQERVKSNIFLKNGTYMEPVEVIFLAMVIEKPIALFDMEGHVLIVIDKEGKLFRPEIKMLENRHQLPEDTCYMFYDFNYKHYWGAQGKS